MATNQEGQAPGLHPPVGVHLLVSRLVGDGEGQSEPRVLVNRAAAVFTAHPAYGSESCGARRAKHVRRDRGKQGRVARARGPPSFRDVHASSSPGDTGHGKPLRNHRQLDAGERGLFSLRESHPGLCEALVSWVITGMSEEGASLQMGEGSCLPPHSSAFSQAWVEQSCGECARQGS